MIPGARVIPARRSAYDEDVRDEERTVPLETPVAIEINGIAYAVMMATPCDIEDFVTGFLLSEGLAQVDEIGPVMVHPVESEGGVGGLVARVTLPPERAAPIMERARRRLGDSSCGICGIESIELALRPLPHLGRARPIAPAAIRVALDAMRAGQVLGRATAATHAAAFADATGAIVALREDVGRHNALDKVIGALARTGRDPASGFLLVTSRCSYELVEKAVRARCPLLVAISAPTDLAVRRAEAAGLALAVVARDDTMLWVTGARMEMAHDL
ncbi:formate dehydrogenase family accessory protein FdhD [Novosphingobium nitrogenifigens DSM 19370]|uniref:Sulfur carrier protein FdhD n=1 Tax=Novosphingobium nitrogenifigens DSM 19370 TaxID=983920 RepID=F1Z7A1_9SPHN|nr:formate dehydrogenase accessory sulfurtransferase FdhD [Novosphingobium nitrogenifigens]EGD59519.1 formate dehydrogenase family accessory protein FdhD [Novosphingobium nitrogenifigens DSM 19370]